MRREIQPDELPPRDPDGSPLGGFGWLLALACLFNFLAFSCLRATDGGGRGMLFIGAAVFGVFPAQLGALTLWLVWGPGPFLRRLGMHWLVGLALYVAWAVGIAIAFGHQGPARELPAVWGAVLCSLPLVSLAAQVALWPLRTHLGWRVEKGRVLSLAGDTEACEMGPRHSPAHSNDAMAGAERPRQPLAVRDILIGTAVTAVSLTGIRVVAALTDAQQENGQLEPAFWLAWGFGVLITAGISLFGLLPALWLFLRGPDRPPRLVLWLGYAALVPFVVLMVLGTMFGAPREPEPFAGLFCLIASFALALAAPLLVARSRGWRLVLPGDRLAAEPDPVWPQVGAANKVAPLAATCDIQPKEDGPA